MLNRVKLHKSHQLISPVRGRLLIAEPFAQDVCFLRSIVLVLDSTDDGYMGLVLNKPLSKTASLLFAKYGLEDRPIHCGGPVEDDRLFYLHNIPEIDGAVRIREGVYVGGDLQEISECLKVTARNYRIKFFMGYAGWMPGQLEHEIKEESWVVSDVCIDVLEVCREGAWKKSLLALKDAYYAMWLNFPFDPMNN